MGLKGGSCRINVEAKERTEGIGQPTNGEAATVMTSIIKVYVFHDRSGSVEWRNTQHVPRDAGEKKNARAKYIGLQRFIFHCFFPNKLFFFFFSSLLAVLLVLVDESVRRSCGGDVAEEATDESPRRKEDAPMAFTIPLHTF